MLRFLELATRGYRLRPWASPYLRWRVETYAGIPAESMPPSVFLNFLWAERKSLLIYLLWVSRTQR